MRARQAILPLLLTRLLLIARRRVLHNSIAIDYTRADLIAARTTLHETRGARANRLHVRGIELRRGLGPRVLHLCRRYCCLLAPLLLDYDFELEVAEIRHDILPL